jgi:hypothetical protein
MHYCAHTCCILSPLQKTPAQQLNSATDRDQQKPTSYPHADAVNVSPEIAERRANLGKDASLGQIQAFDGPAPETINGKEAIKDEHCLLHVTKPYAFHIGGSASMDGLSSEVGSA